MIVDSSAIIAILRNESDAPRLADLMEDAPVRRMSAANLLEAAIVADGSRNPILSRRFDTLIDESRLTIEPVTEKQALLARQAYRDFGKGSGHPARLNFGDCFAYALAKEAGEPLLFKGNDFIHTDVVVAHGS
ncbi:MAG TPA: type II toxin-antitoxin system VapC family toxin [Geminicoccaceae bacterium]|nr:type II toxin-antitoxin system VapC family toxin [Geminicoccus sp.]HMU49702.1 type II toxin-antitoxin system VapC family toxin [Geminicoccaceae bacterium]